MTDHESGAKDRAKEGRGTGGAGQNVVPFPRSWYGTVEELVPIDPAPADPASHASTGVTRPVADANAFWGGEPPPPEMQPEPRAGEATAPTDPVVEIPFRGEATRTASAGPTGQRPHPHPRLNRVWRPSAIGAILLVVIFTGILVAVSLNGRSTPEGGGRRRAVTGSALTVTRTVTQGAPVPRRPASRTVPVARNRRTPVGGSKTLVGDTPPARPRPAHRSHSPTRRTSPHPSGSVPSTGGAPSPTSGSPATSGAPSSNGTTRSQSGTTQTSHRSSLSGCAPSVTNGGACSL